MEFLRSLLRHRFARAQAATLRDVGCLLGLVKTGFFRRLIQSLICKFKAFSYSLPTRKEYFREVQILYRNNIFCTVARKRKQKFIGIYYIGSNFVT